MAGKRLRSFRYQIGDFSCTDFFFVYFFILIFISCTKCKRCACVKMYRGMKMYKCLNFLKQQNRNFCRGEKCWLIHKNELFVYGDHILEARKNHEPIVGLESTIITHGMPFPQNFQTARKVEDAVRKQVTLFCFISQVEKFKCTSYDTKTL